MQDTEGECITTVETEAPARDGTDIPIAHDQLNNSYYPTTRRRLNMNPGSSLTPGQLDDEHAAFRFVVFDPDSATVAVNECPDEVQP